LLHYKAAELDFPTNWGVMLIAPVVDRVSIVLLGNFNPAIFTPAWFAQNQLVSREDSDKADVKVVHPDYSQFTVGELTISVEHQRFIVACDAPRYDMVKDLAIGAFGNVLFHTPLRGIGINREFHFDAGSFLARDAVGARLAPREAWGDWGPYLQNDGKDLAEFGGLLSISLREMHLKSEFRGFVQADLQPSMLPQLGTSGIFMVVNNHYEIKSEGAGKSTDRMVMLLEQEWGAANTKCEFILEQIQKLTLECIEMVSKKK